MVWLFERTVEFAAWVAMIVAWVSAVVAAVWLVLSLWLGRRNVEGQRRGDAVQAPPA